MIALRIIKTCVKMSFLTRNHVKDLEGVLEWLGVGYGQRFLCPRGGKASSLNKGKDCWAIEICIYISIIVQPEIYTRKYVNIV